MATSSSTSTIPRKNHHSHRLLLLSAILLLFFFILIEPRFSVYRGLLTHIPLFTSRSDAHAIHQDYSDTVRKNKGIHHPESEELLSVGNGAGGQEECTTTLLKSCDIYKGIWVKDEKYPLYSTGSCPYVDEAFDCQANGRPDSGYLKWGWKPDCCHLPRFNATDFLVRLKGKKVMMVGDSLTRNQFESLLCLLRHGLQNTSKLYEVNGCNITKGRRFLSFKFEDYNCTVDYVRSHFLVKKGVSSKGQGQRKPDPTLSLDIIHGSSSRWKLADILLFNTGHWWTYGKTAMGKNYYKEGDYIYPQLDSMDAYKKALKTWVKWIDQNISPASLVFYRGYSSDHFRGGDWDTGGTCVKEKEPFEKGSIIESNPSKMRIVEQVIKEMKVPVVILNITTLTMFRKDGHPSIYGKKIADHGPNLTMIREDCSHWCLPGIPDAWNEVFYAALVAKQTSLPT